MTDQLNALGWCDPIIEGYAVRSENSGLRARIGVLEHQLTDLGHTPANGNGTVIISTTESKTFTHPAAEEHLA